MKRSATKAVSSSDEHEPLDAGTAIERTQGLDLKRQRVQDQGNDGERSIPAVSGVALQSTEAGLGLESSSFQDVSRGAIEANRGFAVQPTEAGLGLEYHNFQEQPNFEEFAIQASSGVAVELTQAGSTLESHDLKERPNVEEGSIRGAVLQPMQAGLGHEPQSFQEQPDVEERGGVGLQPTQVALPSPLSRENNTLQSARIGKSLQRNVQAGASHPEEETGSKGKSLLQTSPFDMSDLWNGQGETSHQGIEEEACINNRFGLQAPHNDMDNVRIDGWIELADFGNLRIDDEEDEGIEVRAGQQEMQDAPPQQGTAGRRMLLQVLLCGAEGLSESKRVSIASKQEAEFFPTEPADSRSEDAMREEGDMVGHLRAEGLIACGSKSDQPEVSQQTSQEGLSESKRVSIASSERPCMFGGVSLGTFSSRVIMGTIIGSFFVPMAEQEAEFFPTEPADSRSEDAMREEGDMVGHLRAEGLIACGSKSDQPEVSQQTSQGVSGSCTLALIVIWLFRSICRLTRTAFTYL